MRNEYVSVSFGNSKAVIADPVYQYDHGLVLKILNTSASEIQQAHYAVEDMRETVGLQLAQQGSNLEARIPDNLVAKGKKITAYLYFEDDNAGYTVKTAVIPVIPREKPGTVLMDAPDSSKVGQLVDDLDDLIAEATSAVQTATNAANAAKGTSEQAQAIVDQTAQQLEDMQDATDAATSAAQAATTAVGQVDAKVQEMQTAVNNAKAEAEEAKAAAEAAKEAAESAAGVDEDAIYAAIDTKVDKETGKGLSTNDYTTAEKQKLAGIAANANNYVHPSYTARSSGFYKIQVDNQGHVSGVTPVTAEDINALGIDPPAPATYHSVTLPVTDWSNGIQTLTIADATATSRVVILETDIYALKEDLYWQTGNQTVTFSTGATPWDDVPVKFLLIQTEAEG